MKAQEMHTKSLKLEKNDIDSLNAIASYKKRSTHYIMKEAIQEYILRQEARIQFILEAEKAAQHFEETGLHITLDELGSWVDSIEQNSQESMLKCHK